MNDTFAIPDAILEEHFPGGFTKRDEANAIVAFAFRNGPLENIHAGKDSELLNDDSLSKITDEEMKALMIDASLKIEKLLILRENDPEKYDFVIKSNAFMYTRKWDR